MSNNEKWDLPQLYHSKITKQLSPLIKLFEKHEDWPSIDNYKTIFKQFNLNIKPVPQSEFISQFEEQYESRIYLKNELQTRIHNWHDFFNVMIWLKFPTTKKALNSLHYKSSILRPKGSNRSTLENRITQFDECGAVIISNDKYLLDLIKNHQWGEIFIHNREQFSKNLECVIFGHAIFEKALKPYIGMTCHCILLHNEEILNDVQSGNVVKLDQYLANYWLQSIANHPKKFHAFPVLGIPDYWSPQNIEFYENKSYFR